MAYMVPDGVPPGNSIGERQMYARLQDLPDDCLVYYEPYLKGQCPDFVVVMPDAGILIIECKGWRGTDILEGDLNKVVVRGRPGCEPQTTTHPIRQARNYMHRLMDVCREHPGASGLLQQDGPHAGKFICPFALCVVLTQASDDELVQHAGGSLRAIFPADQVVAADEFEQWAALTTAQLKARLEQFFVPRWSFPRLTEAQVSVFRAVLHPEVALPPTPPQLPAAQKTPPQQESFPDFDEHTGSLSVLDLEQEQIARGLGTGHRLLFGVAGSGKTVVLLARARLLSRVLGAGRVLVLCFNVAFATYLRLVLAPLGNVDVMPFHRWGTRNGAAWKNGEDDAAYGKRLRRCLEEDGVDGGAYEAVLIDEAQDFDPEWFACAMLALREPRNGNLLIVGDGSQSAYRRRRISWKSLGINAAGRTKYLQRNYRNTREIVTVAVPFADARQDEDGVASTAPTPETAARQGGSKPRLIGTSGRVDERKAILEVVKGWLEGRCGDRAVSPLSPSDIAILYRRQCEDLTLLMQSLSSLAPLVWLRAPGGKGEPDTRERLPEPGIKIQTIHSAKGLQYKAVVVPFADQLGQAEDEGELQKDCRLAYVALTRPEEHLAVTYSRPASSVVKMMLATEGWSEA